MQLGMIGLGRMGGNVARRLTARGPECVVYDSHQEAVAALVDQGSKGTTDLPAFARKSLAARQRADRVRLAPLL